MVEMQLKSVVFVTLGSDPHSLFLKLNFIFDALSEIICLPFGALILFVGIIIFANSLWKMSDISQF